MNSMAAANQEITAALQDLAMRDAGFRKGQMRNKAGGKFSASGNKRRVRPCCSASEQGHLRSLGVLVRLT